MLSTLFTRILAIYANTRYLLAIYPNTRYLLAIYPNTRYLPEYSLSTRMYAEFKSHSPRVHQSLRILSVASFSFPNSTYLPITFSQAGPCSLLRVTGVSGLGRVSSKPTQPSLFRPTINTTRISLYFLLYS